MIFNGTYTITNEAGEHRTVRVKTQKEDAKFAPGERIVQLLTGRDNENDYTGFGFVKDDKVNVWRSKQGNGKMSAFDWLAYLLPKAAQALVGSEGVEVEGNIEAAGRKYNVLLSKSCLRCNRKLTTPESIRRGYGEECASRLGLVA